MESWKNNVNKVTYQYTWMIFPKLNLEYLKKVVDIIVPLITTTGLAIAGIYSLVEYQAHQQQRREDKTVELYMKQIDGSLAASRAKLDLYYNSEIRKELLKVVGNTQNYHKFIIEFSKNNHNDIKVMVEFYERIANCVETNVCDQETAKKLFGQEGQEFFQTFYPVFCELRDQAKEESIAINLEQFYSPPKRIKQKIDFEHAIDKSESQVCGYIKESEKLIQATNSGTKHNRG